MVELSRKFLMTPVVRLFHPCEYKFLVRDEDNSEVEKDFLTEFRTVFMMPQDQMVKQNESFFEGLN